MAFSFAVLGWNALKNTYAKITSQIHKNRASPFRILLNGAKIFALLHIWFDYNDDIWFVLERIASKTENQAKESKTSCMIRVPTLQSTWVICIELVLFIIVLKLANSFASISFTLWTLILLTKFFRVKQRKVGWLNFLNRSHYDDA